MSVSTPSWTINNVSNVKYGDQPITDQQQLGELKGILNQANLANAIAQQVFQNQNVPGSVTIRINEQGTGAQKTYTITVLSVGEPSSDKALTDGTPTEFKVQDTAQKVMGWAQGAIQANSTRAQEQTTIANATTTSHSNPDRSNQSAAAVIADITLHATSSTPTGLPNRSKHNCGINMIVALLEADTQLWEAASKDSLIKQKVQSLRTPNSIETQEKEKSLRTALYALAKKEDTTPNQDIVVADLLTQLMQKICSQRTLITSQDQDTRPTLDDLPAFGIHVGSQGSGHFIACVKTNGQWYQLDADQDGNATSQLIDTDELKKLQVGQQASCLKNSQGQPDGRIVQSFYWITPPPPRESTSLCQALPEQEHQRSHPAPIQQGTNRSERLRSTDRNWGRARRSSRRDSFSQPSHSTTGTPPPNSPRKPTRPPPPAPKQPKLKQD